MSHKLSIDEYDALEQVSKLVRNTKPSACVARNTKRLCGIKLISQRKDGGLELTENGRQLLFIQQCIGGLRLIAANGTNDANVTPASILPAVATFLEKKAHIVLNPETGKHEITARGLECLADIDAQATKNNLQISKRHSSLNRKLMLRLKMNGAFLSVYFSLLVLH